ncbi:MAG: DUF2520 domain-containing protein [Calditrichaeota bacterium]|nr:DUF2520 domain-containing protein [Calditrichota bacterium]
MMNHNILIIGAGSLGTSLYKVLKMKSSGHLKLVGHKAKSDLREQLFVEDDYSDRLEIINIDEFEIIMIAVQDDKIKSAAKEIAHFDLKGKTIFHLSGSRAADELKVLSEEGAFIAALHPLQTFPGLFCETDVWSNIIWSFQGDEQAYPVAQEITKILSGKLLKLDARQKLALHVAGVFAANYLVGLLSLAETVLEKASVTNVSANELLFPLVQGVVTNYKTAPAKDILSGPLKRGDAEIIRKHLQFLIDTDGPLDNYKSLAQVILANKDFQIKNREILKDLINI